MIADPAGWARRHREPHWGQLVTEGPQGWADVDGLLRAMDRDGIEKVLLQAWYWENPDNARRQNEWHARWQQAHPDRLLSCVAIHPDLPDPAKTLAEAREWGACAIGECLPEVQSASGWRHPAWETIINGSTAHGWPLILHVTEPVGHIYPGRLETPLMDLVHRFEQHPEQKWLCAHWGGGLPFYSLNRRVHKALKNVWFDTAASPLLYDARIWRIGCDLLGPEKILFGSDFPLRLYPRRDKEPGWGRFLEELAAAGLSAEEWRAIASGNLRRLLEPAQADGSADTADA